MDFMFHIDVGEEWPTECERKYERLEILGKGSFGMVWMSRRVKHPENEEDDEFVAIKSIHIKNEKGKIYAEREIRILQELRHPNVIRLIKAYPVFAQSRVVVMQLARGPNLHDLVVKRGALGLPLSRFVSRQLIAAVSYIHGRAVIHRDIKPSNEIMCRLNSCKNYPFVLAVILSLNNAQKDVDYDWFSDDAIWSSKEDGTGAIQSGKWRVMLVDFGFARALEKDELESQSKKMRNSILFEGKSPSQAELKPEESKSYTPRSMYPTTIAEEESMHPGNADDDSLEADMAVLESMVIEAAAGLRKSYYEAQSPAEEAVMGETAETVRKRHSGVSMAVPPPRPKPRTSRLHVRSMSALGTKAYAAPEIRRQLRRKNEADFEKANAAMTECVADYGMIVDAYSVGWTLRVAMTGVPPNFTISEYMMERGAILMDDEEGDKESDEEKKESFCCCFAPVEIPVVRIRDPALLPSEATLLLTRLTEKKPENRMTVREAQMDPWIVGGINKDDEKYSLPQGNIPSHHGDPVVPLDCAAELSKFTVQYHMQ